MMLLHPSATRLDAFTEGDSSEGNLHRVASHLESCQRCRNYVSFRRELHENVSRLPDPELPAGLFDRIVSDRAAGQRVILPIDRQRTSTPASGVYRIAAIGLIVAGGLGVAYALRSSVPGGRTAAQPSAIAVDEPGLGDLFSATVFLPGVASAGEPAATAEVLQPVGPQIDGTRIGRRFAKYQKRYVDSTGKSTVVADGTVDIRPTRVEGKAAWNFRRDWVEYATKLPGSLTTHDNEAMLLDQRTLRLIRRDIDAFPYNARYSRITVAQLFNGDSIYGKMMGEGVDSRRVSRTFLRRLPNGSAPYISDAFAPLFFTSIRITPGWRGRISVLGWAVRDNDVFYPIELRNVGREKVTVPAGTFDCWHFIITSGPRRYDFWARESDGLAVRTRNEAERATRGVNDLVLMSESH